MQATNERRRSGWQALAAAAALAAALALAACGGGAEEPPAGSPGPTSSPEATAAPAGSPTVVMGTPGGCQPDQGPPQTGTGGEELKGRIAFVRLIFGCQPQIYVMNADGSDARSLSDDISIWDDEPDISPDGQKVVFWSSRDAGGPFLYVINADGTGLKRLSDTSGVQSPRWSPDGSRIALSVGGSLGVMNADGSDLRMIMEAEAGDTAAPCRAGSFVGGWSPDGKRITYYAAVLGTVGTADSPGRPQRFEVCAIDSLPVGADGSNVEVLVSEPVDTLHAEPVWSPDGKKVVYRDQRGSGDCRYETGYSQCSYDIWVLDLETGDETNVTNHPAMDIEPTWSPDGEWILFASNREDPNFDLYVIRPDGTGLRRILDDPGAKDSYPSWVP